MNDLTPDGRDALGTVLEVVRLAAKSDLDPFMDDHVAGFIVALAAVDPPLRVIKAQEDIVDKATINTAEAARRAGVSGDTVRRWARLGLLHPFRVGPGRRYRIDEDELAAVIDGSATTVKVAQTPAANIDRHDEAEAAPLDALREEALARALADAVRQETGWLGEAKTDFWPNLGRDLALIAQRHLVAALREGETA
jgi:excisionase family DNA binding protein